VALFVSGGVQRIDDPFVEFGGLLKAGHATQRQRLGLLGANAALSVLAEVRTREMSRRYGAR